MTVPSNDDLDLENIDHYLTSVVVGGGPVIVPFPLAARRNFVRRQASWFLGQPAQAAESNLFRQIQIQREALLRRGVKLGVVDRECRELERAIRGEAWRQCLTPEAG